MKLNLIYHWWYLRECHHVHKHLCSTITNSYAFGKPDFDHAFHLSPNFMVGSLFGKPKILRVTPVNNGSHPVNQVKVYIFELQFLEGLPESFLDLVLVRGPQLGSDE